MADVYPLLRASTNFFDVRQASALARGLRDLSISGYYRCVQDPIRGGEVHTYLVHSTIIIVKYSRSVLFCVHCAVGRQKINQPGPRP